MVPSGPRGAESVCLSPQERRFFDECFCAGIAPGGSRSAFFHSRAGMLPVSFFAVGLRRGATGSSTFFPRWGSGQGAAASMVDIAWDAGLRLVLEASTALFLSGCSLDPCSSLLFLLWSGLISRAHYHH